MLYNFSLSEVANPIIDEIALNFGVTRTKARKLFINALLYNLVQEEILGQVEFLLDKSAEAHEIATDRGML